MAILALIGKLCSPWKMAFVMSCSRSLSVRPSASPSVCLLVCLSVCLSVTLVVCLSVCFSCCLCCCCCHLIAHFNEIFQRFSRCLCLRFYCNACFSSCCKESPPSIDWAFCVWAAIRRMRERERQERETGERESEQETAITIYIDSSFSLLLVSQIEIIDCSRF